MILASTKENVQTTKFNIEQWNSSLSCLESIYNSWGKFERLRYVESNDFFQIISLEFENEAIVDFENFCDWLKAGEIEAKTECGLELQ